jgi:hypothetical protein
MLISMHLHSTPDIPKAYRAEHASAGAERKKGTVKGSGKKVGQAKKGDRHFFQKAKKEPVPFFASPLFC